MTDVLIIGGGPAGLCAAIEAASYGASVILADENPRMGGQLYKQIHKFFGSKAHFAGTRGFEIAKLLIKQAEELGVDIRPNTRALGLMDDGCVTLLDITPGKKHSRETIQAKTVILATGAKENALPFPGWTIPGVMGAGAAQTFANVHGTLVGKDIVIIGSGNVGLIVGYQLTQAGANIKAIVEAAPKVGGYAVHAGKIHRAGVPLLLSHTILEAKGTEHVTGAVIAKVDEKFRPIPGTEEEIACDTILLATGLSPRTDLASMFRMPMIRERRLGGVMPLHDEAMRSGTEHVYIAGDLAGVEEASTAMDEGRLAGLAAARDCGYEVPDGREAELNHSLLQLRGGEKGRVRREAKAAVIQAFHEKEA